MNFSAIYQKLNQAQKRAVDTIDGPVMVVAGPGTGKTQVLAARIAHILQKTDTAPGSILALTFTDAAATNMKERLIKMIGRTAYYVQIQTFHAFCTEVINSHPEFFALDRQSEPLTQLERYQILTEIISSLELEVLKPINSPMFYLPELIKAISDLKREGIGVAEFKINPLVSGEELKIEEDWPKAKKEKYQKLKQKWQELAQVYQEYEKKLQENYRYDFDDMIILVVEAFKKHEELLREYQENLHYFLIDEYQDTNSAQNKVVDLLASYWGEKANVFVVGDPEQSIFRFQGASQENVLNFTKHYPEAVVINLEVGYRCSQVLYDAAFSLIAEQKITTSALKSVSQTTLSIKIVAADNELSAWQFVTTEIERLVTTGVKPSEIAIIFRQNKEVEAIRTALAQKNIAYQIDAGDDVLKNELIRQFLQLLKLIVSLRTNDEDEYLFEVLSYDWIDLDNLLVMKAARAAHQAKLGLFQLIQAGFDKFIKHHRGDVLGSLDFLPLTEWMERLIKWSAQDANLTLPELIELIIKESGFLDYLLTQTDKVSLLNYLKTLFSEIKRLSHLKPKFKLADFLANLDLMQNYGLSLSADSLMEVSEGVVLTTAHKAKGQEWDYVLIVNCLDGKWGNNKKRELLPLPENLLTQPISVSDNDDERRLFYVSLTRARHQVTIVYPQTTIVNHQTKTQLESMFSSELKERSELKVESIEVALKPEETQLALNSQLKALAPAKTELKAYLQFLLKDFKLSVTALNTYLRDQDEFVKNVLLKVPKAKGELMAFGTAVHRALENYYREIMEQSQKPDIEKLLSWFNQSLSQELLNSDDFSRRLKLGQTILANYQQTTNVDPATILSVERFFGSHFSRTILDDIYLTGRVDRIDWIDKSAKTVRVIDYKTGKPKTKSYIEGTLSSMELSERELSLPLSIRGPYKRQLLFYKLLADLDQSFVPQVTRGAFEFVEVKEAGKPPVIREYDLIDDEVEDLKKLIKEVMAEIRGLGFLS